MKGKGAGMEENREWMGENIGRSLIQLQQLLHSIHTDKHGDLCKVLSIYFLVCVHSYYKFIALNLKDIELGRSALCFILFRTTDY